MITPLNHWIEQKHGFSPNIAEAMSSYQLKKIRETIALAKARSRFYAELYSTLPLPEDLDDFAQYPLISQEDVIARGPQLLCVRQGEIARVVTLNTSGTTGISKQLFFTRSDIDITLDFFQHGMKTLCQQGDRVLILFPAKTPDSVGALLTKALEQLDTHVFCGGVEESVNIMGDEAISVVCGPPEQLSRLSEVTAGAGVRAILSSSDALLPQHKDTLLKNWGCEIFDHYGLTESGLGAAVECACHTGMHIRENDLYFEVLSSEEFPLPQGEYGELVMTTLTRTGMPFIRYRTGDFGQILSGTCPCGSSLRRIVAPQRKLI